jgi:hypothetical protein
MSATLPETTYPTTRIQRQADVHNKAAGTGTNGRSLFAAAGAAALSFGASFVNLLRDSAPAGETSIKRQTL